MVDGDVTRVDPSDLGAVVALQREGQAFGSEPEPDAAHRAKFCEAREDGTDRGQDGFIGMEAHFALLLAPDKAHWKAAAQFAASGLVADSAQEPRPQHIQLGLAHGALEPKQQPVVEQRRMIDAVGIADEGIGEAAQIEQAIPIGIVAGEPRDFEAEHKTDVAERDLCGEPCEAAALDMACAGNTEVLVDDDDELGWPSKLGRFGDQSVLTLCRFAIVLDLSGSGLAQIDVSGTAEMGGVDLGSVIHLPPPFGCLSPAIAE